MHGRRGRERHDEIAEAGGIPLERHLIDHRRDASIGASRADERSHGRARGDARHRAMPRKPRSSNTDTRPTRARATTRRATREPSRPGPAGSPELASAAHHTHDVGPPARALDTLVAIMARLRSPTGCPWDREQTLDTLKPFVLEEAYEVVDAIERGDVDGLKEELGDLVFEAVFLAQLCRERGEFAIEDALEAVNQKLVRRHPHVFGVDASAPGLDSGSGRADARIESAARVVEQWEAIKAREKQDAGKTDTSPLAGIPRSMPALSRAHQMSRRAATVGFDWPSATDVFDKLTEEVAELRDAVAHARADEIEDELGDVLFVLANLARKLAADPETALRRANAKFERRFHAMRDELARDGVTLAEADLDRMERAWQSVKAAERAS
ncbi:MAG: nucleoside triphosphate pyrophosphohydrolase [Vicinamibacterales bacterium]